jgi:hypothetical protein
MMPYPELFTWWAATITWSTVFLTLISIYLYIDSAKRRKQVGQKGQGAGKLVRDFTFVWVLLGLLFLYIVTIDQNSATMFAVGNIVVEILLLIYLWMNKSQSLG